MHASHAPPSYLNKERHLEETLHTQLVPKTAILHPIVINMKTQLPELRLIQYDCGKILYLTILSDLGPCGTLLDTRLHSCRDSIKKCLSGNQDLEVLGSWNAPLQSECLDSVIMNWP